MEDISRETQTNGIMLPFKYFDMIGGTGFGGLIAIMLGRLRMVRAGPHVNTNTDSQLTNV